MSEILPGTIPYPKGKTLYMSLECSEPCTILIEILQNYKDGKISAPMKNKMAKPKFSKEDDESAKALLVHTTPGAAITVAQLMKVRRDNVTPPARKPFDNAKMYVEKIKSLIEHDKEIDEFQKVYK